MFFLSLALLQSIFSFHYLFSFLLHFFFDFLSLKKILKHFPFPLKKNQEMFFNLYLKLKTFLLKKGGLSSRTNYVFNLSFCIYFLRKRMFFASFLNNLLLFSSYKPLFFLHLFSSCFSPLVCLRLCFFHTKKKLRFFISYFLSAFSVCFLHFFF